ncbi:hypothetical protein [Streptomyces natalensis]|uniref:hypothetical protein n=1 Tax=Streptomyces natalensis TaxID=68242 RepID=UPI0012FEC97A|nr:hypothetical protein [Streptomyces natalensis]
MRDAAIVAHFDGRPTAELVFTGWGSAQVDYAIWIGAEFGYKFSSSEPYGRGQYRLILTRDDSPAARLRAAATLARMQSTGSWKPMAQPGSSAPHDPSAIHPERAAQARRNIVTYERWHPAQLVIPCCVVSAGLFSLAWAARGSAIAAVAAGLGGILCMTAAIMGPRYTRKWHQRNLELLERFRRQQAARFPVSPPTPPPAWPHRDQMGH